MLCSASSSVGISEMPFVSLMIRVRPTASSSCSYRVILNSPLVVPVVARYHRASIEDIDRSLAYAKKEMVDDYDTNQNGLSKDETSKMSLTGQLAVLLAKQNK